MLKYKERLLGVFIATIKDVGRNNFGVVVRFREDILIRIHRAWAYLGGFWVQTLEVIPLKNSKTA